jgi:hypothetical protein
MQHSRCRQFVLVIATAQISRVDDFMKPRLHNIAQAIGYSKEIAAVDDENMPQNDKGN